MTIPHFIAEPFFDPGSDALRYLPEGPRMLRNFPEAGKLGWVGIQHGLNLHVGSMNVLDLATRQNRSYALPGRPGFFVETSQPGLVLLGLERDLAYFDLLTGELQEQRIPVTSDERVIINDGLAVEGGVLFGTKHLEFNKPIAALYFFDSATKQVRTVFGGQTCSNGKFLKRDAEGATLIDIDSTPKAVTRYRFDSKLEHVLEQSLVISPHALPATPDGLRPAPDRESVIIAFYNGDAVADGLARQYRISDGALLCEWRFPGSPRVTCPEFVSIGGKVKLLFTTANENMPEATRKLAPGAGTLYLADTAFDEMPAPPPLLSN